MDSKGIYVELPIRTTLDEIWEHTQNPDLHERWDLRFTSIEYLPKTSETDPQRFLYATWIGFGLQISGEGESMGTRQTSGGEATSGLRFWSKHPLSLIRTGSGYWKYIPDGETIRFITWYDYTTRFGLFGKWFDLLVFRPLLGWATALSFDTLRLRLEEAIRPGESIRRMGLSAFTRITLAFIWIYQGLVPKLLFPETGELEIMRATGLFDGSEVIWLSALGIGEILFGILFLFLGGSKWLQAINILALILVFGGAILQPVLLIAPFNPVTLNLAMIALSVVNLAMIDQTPSARRCLRRPRRHDINLSNGSRI